MNLSNCILCGSSFGQVLSYKNSQNTSLKKVICERCGLIRTIPFIEYKNYPEPINRRIVRASKIAIQRIKKIQKYKQNGSILDLSAQFGVFAYFTKKLGFNIISLEKNHHYCDFSREVLETEILCGNIENSQFSPDSFDVVSCYNFLDKVENPLSILTLLNKYLKKEGLIFIDVLDVEARLKTPSRQFNFVNNYNFNHETLKWLLFKAGFELVDEKENSTSLVARKMREPNLAVNFNMPDNYEKLRHLISSYSNINHYKTKTPYLKFLERITEMVSENIQIFKDARSITDNYFNSSFIKSRISA